MTPEQVYTTVRRFIAAARAASAARAVHGVEAGSRAVHGAGRSTSDGYGVAGHPCDDPRDCPPDFGEPLPSDSGHIPGEPGETTPGGGTPSGTIQPFRPGGAEPIVPLPGFRPVPQALTNTAPHITESALPPGAGSAWFDNFGNSLLEPYWTVRLGGFGELASKVIRSSAAPSIIGAGYFADGSVECEYAGSQGIGPCVRGFMSGGYNGYHVSWTSSGGGNLVVRRFTAGTGTTIATIPAAIVNGDRFGLNLVAGNIDITHNGAIVGSAIDGTYLLAGFAGVFAPTSSAQVASFRATPA